MTDKELIIKVIQYIGIIGLFLSGVFAIAVIDKKKKFIFLFLMYVFTGILSFVWYSGFTFFTIGIVFIFFFIILYIVIIKWEIIHNNLKLQKPADKVSMQDRRKITKNVLNIILPLLVCGGLGYLIFNSANKYMAGAGYLNGEQPYNILFSDPGLIIKSIFSSYGPALIILVSSLFISFLWFILIIKPDDKKKNGEEE